MAAAYIEELRMKQPHGPYALAGECVGGVVAFEMAQQLRNAGQQIALLLLMDTWFPTLLGTQFYRRVQRPLELWKQRYLALREGGKSFKHAFGIHLKQKPEHFSPVGPWICFPRDLTRAIMSDIGDVIHSVRFVGQPRLGAASSFRAQINYIDAAMRYRPKPYRGFVYQLVSIDSARKGICEDWENAILGGTRKIVVDGDHESYFTHSAKNISRHISDFMADTQDSGEKIL